MKGLIKGMWLGALVGMGIGMMINGEDAMCKIKKTAKRGVRIIKTLADM